MKADPTKDLSRIFVHEGHLIDEALKKGVREALVRHKKEGRRVVVNRNGQPVRVDPNELDLD